jgi:hypothetical protein
MILKMMKIIQLRIKKMMIINQKKVRNMKLRMKMKWISKKWQGIWLNKLLLLEDKEMEEILIH